MQIKGTENDSLKKEDDESQDIFQCCSPNGGNSEKFELYYKDIHINLK